MSDTTQAVVGSVVSLWRYPVKSMMGEELNAADVTERGLLGDRAYALIDPVTGKVASAKNPRKWGKLFDFRAVYIAPPRLGEQMPLVRVTLPDSTTVTSAQRDLIDILSNVLGREVTLGTPAPKAPSLEEYWPDMEGLVHRETITDEAMPPETFFDFAVIHVLTTATLERLRELYPQGRFEVRRFRPNVVVEVPSGETDFVEDAWIGHTLIIGDDVCLSITGSCPRCVMTTLPQGDLPRDLGILRTAAQHNQVNVGVYAAVLRGGTIHHGDPVRLE
ncbi:MAG: MOSC N-terminal beta barrel domain-containing protein [candidate division NC10 bacterium]